MNTFALVALVGYLRPFKPVVVPDALRVLSTVLLATFHLDVPVAYTCA